MSNLSGAQPQSEPSMEEILASIRRIISDEGAPAGAASSADKPGPAIESPADDVLELTPDMQMEPPQTAPGGVLETAREVPPPEPAPAPTLEKLMASFGAEDQPLPPPIKPMVDVTPVEEPRTMTYAKEEGLISAQTEASAVAALAGLKALNSGHKFEGGTVEALVRELLRPMIKEWMDAHLPSIVERIVEAEVARVSQRTVGH